MGNETEDVLRRRLIDGSYSFEGGALKIDPTVFQGPDSANHVRLLVEALKAGLQTEIREPYPTLLLMSPRTVISEQ